VRGPGFGVATSAIVARCPHIVHRQPSRYLTRVMNIVSTKPLMAALQA